MNSRSFYVTALAVALLTCGWICPAANAGTPAHSFVIGKDDFLLDGKPFLIRCGEIHFARVPREYWRHRLQMCRGLGLNTVCVYLFWNFHERTPGHFDWTGSADVAEFCRIAQQEGLWVLLRPGPYSCAEWEMGGLPWWLLKNERPELRTKSPVFLEPATRYLKEVCRVLAPLQISRGGPILMVQVENEYGSFGRDAEYMGALAKALQEGGIDVPLFASNPPNAIQNGFRSDLFQVVNFGAGGGPKAFEVLRKTQSSGPQMNGEYYPAWFDTWGRSHRLGNNKPILADLEDMLKNNRSFSIYMAHGGSSFGLWAGANRPFSPDTTSYDYDAPISEAGWETAKFDAIRSLFSRYLQAGETLPPAPAPLPVISFDPVSLTESASVFENLPAPITDKIPRTMEAYNQAAGCMLYRIALPAGPAGVLTLKAVHDFAWIFVDGRLVGTMDRRSNRYRVVLPARKASARLDLFVEAMGRVNFGSEVADRKGIHAPVEWTPAGGARTELKQWLVFSFPLDAAEISSVSYKSAQASGPAFWRGTISIPQVGDTFLDLRSWGKGVAWVNGHCLGRFWNIGPQQTLYVPGVWLHPGRNEVVVLDVLGPRKSVIAGLSRPILDELHTDLDFAATRRAAGTFTVSSAPPAASGSFTEQADWQSVSFSESTKGRYLCMEALNALDGGVQASVAELEAMGAAGAPLSKSHWKIFWADSESRAGMGGEAENLLDGQSASCWQTEPGKPFPHRVVIDLGESTVLTGIRYLPRAGNLDAKGRLKDYRIYVDDSPFGLTPPSE